MSVKSSKVRVSFVNDWEKTEKKFRAAGMTDEQIKAMYEYDLHAMNRERAEVRRRSSTDYDELIKAIDHGENDQYFQKASDLDTILDNIQPNLSTLTTPRDKEILKIFLEGKNQREAAETLGIRQQVIARHMKKIRNFLKKGV